MTICKTHHMTPFELFKQDVFEVIMLINYYIAKGNAKPREAARTPHRGNGAQPVRVRVTEKTATGGWY